jgi:predicted TIM-barrel fold metal-dependent hydrolase
MIVDTHTHWGIVWEDTYGTDPSEWLKTLDRHNVEKALLMGHRGLTRNADIARSNDIVRETCDRSGGRLVPAASVHPDFGDEAVRELERCLDDLGMRGLKLHPWIQGVSTAGTVMDELVKVSGARNVPVIFHDGTPCYSMPSQIGGLAMRFPETTFVLGHSGLLDLWRSAMSIGQRCANVWFTLSGPHLAGIQAIVDTIDSDRIMWGSDYGFGWADSIDYRLHLLDHVRMSDSTRRKIMSENAVRLFRL